MDSQINFFNPAPPLVMHIDLNSCFASIEQQANPLLRNKPVAVAASSLDYGCILAPSIEAKLYGVKTGMTVREGRELCPYLIIREADPDKYREIHHAIGQVLGEYSAKIISKSIDEYCLDFHAAPPGKDPIETARKIKTRIKHEVGEYLRTSIGISTNQNLAKLASGLHKPDGLNAIDKNNYLQIYSSIKLQDFCGINTRNEAHLNRVGVFTPLQFYEASLQTLKSAFGSILGRCWHSRLRGYEVDDIQFSRRSFGQSYVLPHAMKYEEWTPILKKLVAKASRRLRRAGFYTSGTYLALRFNDGTSFHKGYTSTLGVQDDPRLVVRALEIYQRFSPKKSVKKIAISFFDLKKDVRQLSLVRDEVRQKELLKALDQINDIWGEYTLTYGSILGSENHVRDAISFGK